MKHREHNHLINAAEKCTVFNKHDGLNTNLFNINSGIATSDGKLYIGSNNGFIIITPDGLKNNTIKPITIFINTSEKKQEDNEEEKPKEDKEEKKEKKDKEEKEPEHPEGSQA